VYSDLIEDGLPKLTAKTLTATTLKKDLQEIVARGYAVEREEAVIGEAGIAAPIFDRRGETIGAVGVAGPRERLLRKGREAVLADAVIQAAKGISRDLGAPRWPANA
jgi:DNA-binding IclR family transcriptional regulator